MRVCDRQADIGRADAERERRLREFEVPSYMLQSLPGYQYLLFSRGACERQKVCGLAKQEDVKRRAKRNLEETMGSEFSSPKPGLASSQQRKRDKSPPGSQSGDSEFVQNARPPPLPEAIDVLRAEVARAGAVLRKRKL